MPLFAVYVVGAMWLPEPVLATFDRVVGAHAVRQRYHAPRAAGALNGWAGVRGGQEVH